MAERINTTTRPRRGETEAAGNGTPKRSGRGETEERAREEHVPATEGLISEVSTLVLLQVNCRSICNKILEFWNLIDTYNPDVVIGTESWLSEEINNAEFFRDGYIIFRRDRFSRGGGVFICVKITSIAGNYGWMRTLR